MLEVLRRLRVLRLLRELRLLRVLRLPLRDDEVRDERELPLSLRLPLLVDELEVPVLLPDDDELLHSSGLELVDVDEEVRLLPEEELDVLRLPVIFLRILFNIYLRFANLKMLLRSIQNENALPIVPFAWNGTSYLHLWLICAIAQFWQWKTSSLLAVWRLPFVF